MSGIFKIHCNINQTATRTQFTCTLKHAWYVGWHTYYFDTQRSMTHARNVRFGSKMGQVGLLLDKTALCKRIKLWSGKNPELGSIWPPFKPHLASLTHTCWMWPGTSKNMNLAIVYSSGYAASLRRNSRLAYLTFIWGLIRNVVIFFNMQRRSREAAVT